MFLKTITLLKLLNIKVSDKKEFNSSDLFASYLEHVCNDSNHIIITEIFKYESLKFKKHHVKLKSDNYINQLSIYRANMQINEDDLLNITFKYNDNLEIFESIYSLDRIISIHELAVNTLKLEDLQDALKIEEDNINNYCFRKSYFDNESYIEYKINNFGLLLLDIKEHNQPFTGKDLLIELNKIYEDVLNTKETLIHLLKSQFTFYHSIEILE